MKGRWKKRAGGGGRAAGPRLAEGLGFKRRGRALGWGLPALCLLVLAGLALTFCAWFGSRGEYRKDYEGVVVGKSVTPDETRLGTLPVRRLLVREKGGRQFQVVVGESTYEQAREGMLVRSGPGGVQLSRPTPAPGADTKGAEHPPMSAPGNR